MNNPKTTSVAVAVLITLVIGVCFFFVSTEPRKMQKRVQNIPQDSMELRKTQNHVQNVSQDSMELREMQKHVQNNPRDSICKILQLAKNYVAVEEEFRFDSTFREVASIPGSSRIEPLGNNRYHLANWFANFNKNRMRFSLPSDDITVAFEVDFYLAITGDWRIKTVNWSEGRIERRQ